MIIGRVHLGLLIGVLVTPVIIAGNPTSAGQTSHTAVDRALQEYELGHQAAAVRLIAASTTVDEFLADIDRWIERIGASDKTRGMAATFALDVVWNSDERPDIIYEDQATWTRSLYEETRLDHLSARLPVISWGSEQLKKMASGSELERWWWHAAIGALQGVRAWDALLGGRFPPGASRYSEDSPVRSDVHRGLLAKAEGRLGTLPRLQLARTISTLARDLGSARPWPDVRPGALRDEPHPRGRQLQEGRQRFNDLLGTSPSLEVDVRMQLAYIDVRLRRWQDALAQLDACRGLDPDAFLRATMHHLRGWALERSNRPGEATTAYREALALVPDSKSSALRLSALLFLDGQRLQTDSTMDAVARVSIENNLVARFELGDAYLVPSYLTRARASLR